MSIIQLIYITYPFSKNEKKKRLKKHLLMHLQHEISKIKKKSKLGCDTKPNHNGTDDTLK